MTFFLTRQFASGYPKTTAVACTAANSDFEPAIAVFGLNSETAFAAVSGPLVEAPVLISRVSVALCFQRKDFQQQRAGEAGVMGAGS